MGNEHPEGVALPLGRRPDPAAVRAAAEMIEHHLGVDPAGAGRHMSEGLWRIHVSPLLVHYSIDPVEREVKITQVDFAA